VSRKEREMTLAKRVKKVRRGQMGRPKSDPAKVGPTQFIGPAAKRYGLGRDQMKAAVEAKEVDAILINGRWRVITSKADRQFGLIPTT
jgi:hypothetical protein